MATFTSHEVGSPCWVDLTSPDPDAAKRFCSAVFGWTADDQFDDDGNYIYTLFRHDGQIATGLGGQPPQMAGMPAVWNTYIATDDPAAVAEKVAAAGGTVMMPPMQVMASGEMAVFADPTGAVFSVWKAGDHFGAEVGNVADTWSWNELMTRDLPAAAGFYSEVFGWGYDEMDMGPMGTYHVVQGGETGWAGMMAMPPGMPEMVPAHWATYFTVADIEATMTKVKNADGQIMDGPMEVPGIGHSAVIHHEAAGSFQILQPVAEATE
jgi:predicted enzyme related to lactoylglutathione lyase